MTKQSLPNYKEALERWELCLAKKNPYQVFVDFYKGKKYSNGETFTAFDFWHMLQKKEKWEVLLDFAQRAYENDKPKVKSTIFPMADDRYSWWLPITARAYLHLGKMQEAKERLSVALIHGSMAEYEALAVLVEWYEANNDKKSAAIVYHGAAFALDAVFHRRNYDVPKDIENKFDKILDEWLSIEWDKPMSGHDREVLKFYLGKICDRREKFYPRLSARLRNL